MLTTVTVKGFKSIFSDDVDYTYTRVYYKVKQSQI